MLERPLYQPPRVQRQQLRTANIVPFAALPPKRPPYRPHPMNGTVWVVGEPGDYAVLHYSSSGNSAGLTGGFQTLREAESEAWREARRRQAIFYRTDSREVEADNARTRKISKEGNAP